MRTLHFRTGSAASLLVVLSLFAFLQTSRAQDPAPDLELPDLTGQLRKLDDYRGHVVVLNFWATWCGPCAKEMPIFVETQHRYDARGVVLLAASLDAEETKSNIPAFIQKHKMDFPVMLGATVDHLDLFGMGDGLPGTVFLDADGHIFARILGEAKKKDVFARVEWLLGDRKGKNPKPPKPVLGKITSTP
ncbi:MAG: TlpA family protein disulfide reductase [Acidobacteria bacterium]|nr:TlpA family protein disulfide reductase [Acidobacteriota bacterium]